MAARFWVVACPRCRKAKVCRAGQRTTTCGHCGRRLGLAGLRKHLETPSPEAARRAAGLLNARLAGRLDAFLEAPREAAPAHPSRASRGGLAGRVRALALELAAHGPFREEDFAAALARAGLPVGDAAEHLARLVAEGSLFEPRRGRYAAP